MKVKLKEGVYPIGLEHGVEYSVITHLKDQDQYVLKNQTGYLVTYHTSHFEIIDEPKIEVGSEWVTYLKKQGEKTLKVISFGDHLALCKWIESGKEFSSPLSRFNGQYKPKPKTVTMYFHNHLKGHMIASVIKPDFTPVLFTREIDLP